MYICFSTIIKKCIFIFSKKRKLLLIIGKFNIKFKNVILTSFGQKIYTC